MGKHSQPLMDEIAAYAHWRLTPFARKWKFYRGRSAQVLAGWNRGTIDVLYLDGSHHAHDVVTDFVLAFPHLKLGSLVVFDDYGIALRKRDYPIPDVASAVEAIMHAFKIFLEPTGQGKQFYARVIRKPEIGRYIVPADLQKTA